MRPAQPGRIGMFAQLPNANASADSIGNTGVQVVSSPWLVGLLEEASHRAVRDLYEEGEVTVGTHINVQHIAPANLEREIIAIARLETQDNRRLCFRVSVRQDEREIMRGTHERATVHLGRFLNRTSSSPRKTLENLLNQNQHSLKNKESIEARCDKNEAIQTFPISVPTNKPTIEFFFDYHSPWCYFSALRLGALARRLERKLIWKPIHLAQLIEQIDGRRPLEANAAFVRWFKMDMQDTADRLGVEFSYHPQFPLRPSRALRATIYADQHHKAEEFVTVTMRAYWAQARDISSLDELATIGESVGLKPDHVCLAAQNPSFKQVVESNTLEAQQRGVFGAPSFFCDNKLFWGNDHLEQLETFASRRMV